MAVVPMYHRVLSLVLLAGLGLVLTAAAVEPTHKDQRYSKQYDRSVLDVWLPANAEEPTPLVVYFHGGSFTHGDKSAFRRNAALKQLEANGIAYASVNYPLLKDATYLEIMVHAGQAIRFLRAQSEDWNIDGSRIAVAGSSAGAMIAEYLTYALDLQISAGFADQQPYRSWFLLPLMDKGEAPLLLYTRSGPKDSVHHPDNAKLLKARADQVGIACDLYGTAASGLPKLPDGTTIDAHALASFRKSWATADKQ